MHNQGISILNLRYQQIAGGRYKSATGLRKQNVYKVARVSGQYQYSKIRRS